MTTDAFSQIVLNWLDTARHPQDWNGYTPRLTYLPMLELLNYLRGNGFKTFIVSGGGQRLRAPMDSEQGVWHSARAGDRQQYQDEIRIA